MRSTVTTLLASLTLAAALTPAAAQAAPFRAVETTLAVEVTGIHVLDWHTQSDGYGDPRREWSEERGTQTYGIRTPKPLRYRATRYTGRAPGGVELPPLLLSPLGSTPPVLRGVVQRRVARRWNEIGYCGGEYGECTGQERNGIESSSRRCGPQTVSQRLGFDATAPSGRPRAREILLELPVANAVFSACEGIGGAHGAALDDQLPPGKLFLPGALRKLRQLARGRTVTFRRSFEHGWSAGPFDSLARESDRCPPLSGPGRQGCVVTELTVEVTRLR